MDLLWLGVGLLAGWLPSWGFYLVKLSDQRKVHQKKIEEIKEAHRIVIQEIIQEFNHHGDIPISLSLKGLIGCLSWAIMNSIKKLELLYEKQDWNTKSIITELREIIGCEVRMMYEQIDKLIKHKREVLLKNNKHQLRDDEL